MARSALPVLIALIIFHCSKVCGQGSGRQDSVNAGPLQISEKVYLHIDREIYNCGDDIWFKGYVIDALNNKPSPNTNNLHVELISPEIKIVQSRIVRIENGTGHGDFNLSDSLSTGRYRIRAYTNHMRNFDDLFFFNKEIVIINPVDGWNELNKSAKYAENKIQISFFPEGGSLIDNVTSVVAFKAVTPDGMGCNVSGTIYSSLGDSVTELKSSHLGMGSFKLQPDEGLKYYTVFTAGDGPEYRADIPKSFAAGTAIHALVTEEKKLLLKVSTNDETLTSPLNRQFNVSISSRNLITETFNIRINSPVSNFLIPLGDLPEGILRITLTGIDGLPLCERLVFYQKPDDVSLEIATDKKVYSPREQVRFRISISGDSSLHDKAFLSFSAAEARAGNDSSLYPSTIASWFLLESDVRGYVEEPSCYFEVSNKKRFQDLDLLLLTQGWRDFQWKYDPKNTFKHEIGFSVSGRARRFVIDKPLKGARINAAIISDKKSWILRTLPDSLGYFRLNGFDITGKARLIVTVSDKINVFRGQINIDSVVYRPANVDLTQTEPVVLLNKKYSELKQEAAIKASVRKKYKLTDTINIDEVVVTGRRREQAEEVLSSRSHYIRPDHELIITPQLETRMNIFQAMDGRIPGVEVSGESITVRGQTPLILMDGIPVFDNSEVSAISPSMVDRVDVLYWSSLYGSQGANGIVNFITKRGGYNYAYKEGPHAANISIKGFDAPRIFYSPGYPSPGPSAFLPDDRITIHWEPEVTVQPGAVVPFSFYNADRSGKIGVKVVGMTEGGIPLTRTITYEVK